MASSVEPPQCRIGWTTAVPGLVLWHLNGMIYLCHDGSIGALATFPTVGAGRGAAVAMAEIADWSDPCLEVTEDMVRQVDLEAWAYGGGIDIWPEGALDDQDLFVGATIDGTPPTTKMTKYLLRGWTTGVPGLRLGVADARVALLHVESGRQIADFETVVAGRQAALELGDLQDWAQSYLVLAVTGREFWEQVQELVSDVRWSLVDEPVRPPFDCLVDALVPGWSTPVEHLDITSIESGLVVVEARTGVIVGPPRRYLGEARADAIHLGDLLDKAQQRQASDNGSADPSTC